MVLLAQDQAITEWIASGLRVGPLSDKSSAEIRGSDERLTTQYLWPALLIEALKIVALFIVASVVYGILHDQVKARICVEYFTIGHPPVFPTESPTLIASGWGIIATWWSGLLVGVALACTSRVGSCPKIDASRLIRPVGIWMFAMACTSLLAGMAAYFSAIAGKIWLWEPLSSQIAESKHAAFLADAGAHLSAYGAGFLGGALICGWTLFRRRQLAEKLAEAKQLRGAPPVQNPFQASVTSMRLRYVTLFIAAAIAGLYWNLSSSLLFIHLIAPPMLACVAALLLRRLAWEQQLLVVLSVLTTSELVRAIAYCVAADGWRYVSSDGETPSVMLFSFAVQCLVASVTCAVTRVAICRLTAIR